MYSKIHVSIVVLGIALVTTQDIDGLGESAIEAALFDDRGRRLLEEAAMQLDVFIASPDLSPGGRRPGSGWPSDIFAVGNTNELWEVRASRADIAVVVSVFILIREECRHSSKGGGVGSDRLVITVRDVHVFDVFLADNVNENSRGHIRKNANHERGCIRDDICKNQATE